MSIRQGLLLCLNVRESRLLYNHIYTFCVVVSYLVVFTHDPLEHESFLKRSLCSRDCTPISDQSGPEKNDNESVLYAPLISRIGSFPSDPV